MVKSNRYNQSQNFVEPEERQLPTVRRMTPEEAQALARIGESVLNPVQAANLPEIEGTHTGHVRHVDDPISNARASLLYSITYMIVAAFVIGALLMLTDLTDGDFGLFIGFEIVGTGLVGLISLSLNRMQGLHHSATGIAHGEIKARERMLDRLADVEEHRIDADTEVRLAEVKVRRELGQEFVKRIGGQ